VGRRSLAALARQEERGVVVNMLQTYETSILSDDSDHAIHVVVVPKRSLPLSGDFPLETVFQELELTKLAPTDPSNLARHLAVLFSSQLPNHELPQTLASAAMATNPQFQPSPDDIRFAEFVSFERLIPIEESPLSQESLAKLATTASGVGIGAFIGFVAFGSSPFLLITVPVGMIICGAARGVGQALEEGLRDRLVRWLKGEKAERPRPPRRRRQDASETPG
jgi:hypothetical protein